MRRPWLAPFVPLYAAGLALRDLSLRKGWEPTRELWFPVVSIGNLSTGGAGKTPLAIAITRLLQTRGYAVDVLSRGYGRQAKDTVRVDPDGTALRFGDEPLLIARTTGVPVYVSPQRYDAGYLAEQEFLKQDGQMAAERLPLIHLLDDGFQHRQLHRDVDIVLVDHQDWRDSLIPAGNRRELLRSILRAGVVAIPSGESRLESDLRQFGWAGPFWRLRRQMQVPTITSPVLAFCAIARPGQFFAGLESAGLTVASRVAFRDHHRWSPTDIERLAAAARRAGARALVTTEKDFVRFGTLSSSLPPDLPVHVASLVTQIEEEDAAMDWLEGELQRSPLAEATRESARRSAKS